MIIKTRLEHELIISHFQVASVAVAVKRTMRKEVS